MQKLKKAIATFRHGLHGSLVVANQIHPLTLKQAHPEQAMQVPQKFWIIYRLQGKEVRALLCLQHLRI